jgi:hypothetical protein
VAHLVHLRDGKAQLIGRFASVAVSRHCVSPKLRDGRDTLVMRV